jgi:hypothetical protein
MLKKTLNDFKLGWVVGNFEPSLIKTKDFEVCVKYFTKGEVEPAHYQRIATEITIMVSGEAILGDLHVVAGDVIQIDPLEVAAFEALSDVALVAIKYPSIPEDKVVI